MQKIQSFIASSVLIAGISHIFCCGIPLAFSFLSVLIGAGVATFLPAGMMEFHEILHVWEIPLLIFSGAVLFVGWGLHIISEMIDCHNTGCVHEPCGSKKKKSHRILLMATILFCINATVLFTFHGAELAEQDYAHHTHSSSIHE